MVRAPATASQPPFGPELGADGGVYGGDASFGENKHTPIHRWVPWIAGFSGQFVSDVIDAYVPKTVRADALVLDPFAGVGTTLVEALKAGCNTVGYEINPFAALAANTKIGCIDVATEPFAAEVDSLCARLHDFEHHVDLLWRQGGDEALAPALSDLRVHGPERFKSRIPFFSPPVEAKVLFLLSHIQGLPEPDRFFFLVALGAQMVSFSNYTYEPSLSSRPGAGKPLIQNASVGTVIAKKLGQMLQDITWAQSKYRPIWSARRRQVYPGSYFASGLAPSSVSLIVTSPPYMNNYHYPRNTRPHLYWLKLVNDGRGLQDYEKESFGKFWQTVRQQDPIALSFELPCLSLALDHLRGLNAERRPYGGQGWANYVATYCNDSWRFLSILTPQLAIGRRAVIVVGNSIIQGIEFKVDQLLGDMAERHGLRVDEIRVLRTKRVGNSILNSAVRNGEHVDQTATRLYDAAVVLERVR